MKRGVIRVLRHAGSPTGDPNPHARLGAGRYPYSASSGTKSVSFSVKIKDEVSTNVLSKSNHTHGGVSTEYNALGKSRIRLGFTLRNANFLCRGSFERKDFQSKFSLYRITHSVGPHRTQILSCYRTPHLP